MSLQPYRLVPDNISTNTVEALETLLSEARAGRIVGIAFAALYKGRVYIANSAGEVHRNPTFGRGMTAALDDYFSKRVLDPTDQS